VRQVGCKFIFLYYYFLLLLICVIQCIGFHQQVKIPSCTLTFVKFHSSISSYGKFYPKTNWRKYLFHPWPNENLYGAAVGMQHMKVYWVATSHSLSIFPSRKW